MTRQPLPDASRAARRRVGAGRQRGVVTVELALSLLAVIAVLAMASWALLLVMAQIACQDTASAVARQAARGDRAGVAAAEAARPTGSEVSIERAGADGRIVVEVVDHVRPPGDVLPPVTLRARAVAVAEPGAGR